MGILMRIISASVVFYIMSSIGYGATTWQYWAVFICLIVFGTSNLFET